MKRCLPFAILLLSLSLDVYSQNVPPAFEVASIKPNNQGNGTVMIRNSPGGRFTSVGLTLKALIAYAYRIRDFQISGGPGWIGTDKFDIEAKADWDAATQVPQGQLTLMLQQLLAERFQLK